MKHRDVRVVIGGDRQEHLVAAQDKKLGVVLAVEQVATPAPGPFVLLYQGIVLNRSPARPGGRARDRRVSSAVSLQKRMLYYLVGAIALIMNHDTPYHVP